MNPRTGKGVQKGSSGFYFLFPKIFAGVNAIPLPDLVNHCGQVNFTHLRLNKGKLSGKALLEGLGE